MLLYGPNTMEGGLPGQELVRLTDILPPHLSPTRQNHSLGNQRGPGCRGCPAARKQKAAGRGSRRRPAAAPHHHHRSHVVGHQRGTPWRGRLPWSRCECPGPRRSGRRRQTLAARHQTPVAGQWWQQHAVTEGSGESTTEKVVCSIGCSDSMLPRCAWASASPRLEGCGPGPTSSLKQVWARGNYSKSTFQLPALVQLTMESLVSALQVMGDLLLKAQGASTPPHPPTHPPPPAHSPGTAG